MSTLAWIRQLAAMVTLAVGALNTAHAATYTVWGDNDFSTTVANWFEQGYDPAAHGSVLLGSASDTQTFNGTYTYYIINTAPVLGNVVGVDAVLGSDGQFYNTYATGNTPDYYNAWGYPDGVVAHVGASYNGVNGGFIMVETGGNLSSLTVVTAVPEPAAWLLFALGLGVSFLNLRRRHG